MQKKGSDEVYYWHTATGKTSWERPVATKPEVLEACSDKRSPQGSLNSAPIVDETGLVRSDTDDRDIEDGVRSDVDEEDEAYEARKRARKETDEERAAAEAVATETWVLYLCTFSAFALLFVSKRMRSSTNDPPPPLVTEHSLTLLDLIFGQGLRRSNRL